MQTDRMAVPTLVVAEDSVDKLVWPVEVESAGTPERREHQMHHVVARVFAYARVFRSRQFASSASVVVRGMDPQMRFAGL